MKTLDEVIDDFEKACDLERRCENCSGCLGQENGCPYDGAESVPDALHYLREYRDLKNTMDWHEEMEEIRGSLTNEPLAWDELKSMVGKPVLVEDNIDEPEDLKKYWAIYRRIEKAQETEYALLCDLYYDKAEYGTTWQAYRKERK